MEAAAQLREREERRGKFLKSPRLGKESPEREGTRERSLFVEEEGFPLAGGSSYLSFLERERKNESNLQ